MLFVGKFGDESNTSHDAFFLTAWGKKQEWIIWEKGDFNGQEMAAEKARDITYLLGDFISYYLLCAIY